MANHFATRVLVSASPHLRVFSGHKRLGKAKGLWSEVPSDHSPVRRRGLVKRRSTARDRWSIVSVKPRAEEAGGRGSMGGEIFFPYFPSDSRERCFLCFSLFIAASAALTTALLEACRLNRTATRCNAAYPRVFLWK